jgi:hypothetical protein
MKNIVNNVAFMFQSNAIRTLRSFIKHRDYQFLVITLLLLSGCANHFTPETYSDPYGFFSGIWHGLIFPITFIINITWWCLTFLGIEFLTDIQIIGRPNTGFLFYYIGFILGLSAHFGVGAR